MVSKGPDSCRIGERDTIETTSLICGSTTVPSTPLTWQKKEEFYDVVIDPGVAQYPR